MLYDSPYPMPPVPALRLEQYVLEPAARLGDKPALVDGEDSRWISYRELRTRVDAQAAGLLRAGVRAGEVIALVGKNEPAWAVTFHAVLRAGAVVAPLSPMLVASERQAALRELSAVRVLAPIELGHVSGAGDPLPDGLPAGDTLAVLARSSGTTGIPKPVMLTHGSLVANLVQHEPVHLVTEQDVVLAALPFFHIYGLGIVLNYALRHGATVVTLPRFELRAFLSCIEQFRVTRLYLAPPLVLALATAEEVASYDLSSLRAAACGAAPIDPALLERAAARIGCPIVQGFGMTEASPGTHFTPEARSSGVPCASVGHLLPGTQARLVNATGCDAEPENGEATGELWIRGPQVMAGYLDAPEVTAQTLTPEGFLRTGDIVRVDAAGAYYVVDRQKELIKYKGYQVAPAELEALLRTHPAIRDAAVVGVPDLRAGEIPKAFVVVDGELDDAALLRWVAERVAPYKKIRAVERVAEIPRSPAGKILRRLLREAARPKSADA